MPDTQHSPRFEQTSDQAVAAAVADLRVLVADDDMADMICKMLKFAGFTHVDPAFNGRDALALHAAQPYDLIILNRNMPRMSGVEALRRLRSVGDAVAVIMTAAGELDEIVHALDVREIIEKPFSIKYLVTRVCQVLAAEQARHRHPGPADHADPHPPPPRGSKTPGSRP